MSASSNLARTTDTCPWSVTDTHATLRRSRTRFDSWLGHYENNRSRLWPASGMDSTVTSNQLDGVRLPGGLLETTDGTVRKRHSGQAQTLVPVGSNPTRATWSRNDESQQTIHDSTGQWQRRDVRQRLGHGRVDGSSTRAWNIAVVEVESKLRVRCQPRRNKPTQTKLLWHGTRIGTAAKLKPSCLRVRLPPVLLENELEEQHGPFVYR